MKEKIISIKVDERLHKRLKVFAATHGTTVKDIVIRGIEDQIKRKKGGPENGNNG